MVIALAALFVPHYLGSALGWESAQDGPWDALIGIAVILAVAGARRLKRVRLYKVAVAMVAAALVVQVAIAVIGFAVVVSADALSLGTDLGTAPSWSSIALALALATLAYTGIESVSSYAAEVREPGRTLPRSLFVGIGVAVAVNVAVAVVGVSAFPAEPNPEGPDGVASGLGTEWLKAPLVGIASAVGDEIGGRQALEMVVGRDRGADPGRGRHHGDGGRASAWPSRWPATTCCPTPSPGPPAGPGRRWPARSRWPPSPRA